MKRISPLDHAWLLLESRDTPMHVGGLFEYTKPEGAGPELLTETLADVREQKTVPSPWNLKLVDGPVVGHRLPLMVEDRDVDLEYHVRHSALPHPGGQRELGILVSRLHSQPARHAPAAVGDPHDRRPRGTGPLRRLHQDAPLADRRGQRHADAAALAQPRPRRAGHELPSGPSAPSSKPKRPKPERPSSGPARLDRELGDRRGERRGRARPRGRRARPRRARGGRPQRPLLRARAPRSAAISTASAASRRSSTTSST